MKNGVKVTDSEDLLGVKSANRLELSKKRQLWDRKPGLYAIGSRKLNLIGIWGSKRVKARVRKLQSSFNAGVKMRALDDMGIRYAGDVVFQVLEECEPAMWGLRMKHWREYAEAKKYTVWNKGEVIITPDLGIGGTQERISQIMNRFGISEAEMLGILDTLERGLSETRGRG